MLLRLARYGVASPWRAALIVAATSLVALIPILSLVGVIGLALLVLVGARMGERANAHVLLVATVVATIFLVIAGQSWLYGVMLLLGQWLPVAIVASVLRHSQRLRTAILVAIGLGIAIGGLTLLMVVSQGEMLQKQFVSQMAPTFQQQGITPDQLDKTVRNVLPWLPSLIGGVYTLLIALSILLGRSWQAALYNPGGFRQEFYSLRFGLPLALVATALAVLVFVATPWSAVTMVFLMPIAVAFMLHAVAIAHDGLARRKAHPGWLFAMYVMIVLTLPNSLAGLAVVGMLDAFMNLRGRAGSAGED